MRKWLYPLIILVILVIGGFMFYPALFPSEGLDGQVASTEEMKSVTVTAPLGKLSAMVADNEITREKGLGDRESLGQNEAMLFVFDIPGTYGFWMKDMKFPIDFIWLDSERNVLDVTPSISPDTYPEAFYPPSDVIYVIETNAGIAEKLGIKAGIALSW